MLSEEKLEGALEGTDQSVWTWLRAKGKRGKMQARGTSKLGTVWQEQSRTKQNMPKRSKKQPSRSLSLLSFFPSFLLSFFPSFLLSFLDSLSRFAAPFLQLSHGSAVLPRGGWQRPFVAEAFCSPAGGSHCGPAFSKRAKKGVRMR
jgi:hypothetical protein